MDVSGRNERILLLEQQIVEMESALEEAMAELHHKDTTLEELVKANADFDNLLVNAEIGALFIHKDMTIRKITPIMSRNTRLHLTDTGESIENVFFMDDYDTFARDVETCFQKEISLEREVASDGVTWMIRMCPYYAVDAAIDGVLVILFDITKRLEASKLELQTLINNVPGVVTRMRYEEDGLIMEYANDAAYRMLHLSKREFHRRFRNHYEKIMLPEDWQRLRKMILERKQTGERISLEYQVSTREGSIQWRVMQGVILERPDGAPVLQCVIMDITEEKSTQVALQREREKLSTILSMQGDMIFEYDIREDYMRYANSGEGILEFYQMTEHYVKNILTNPIYEDQENARRLAKVLTSGEKQFEVELRRRGADGQLHWVLVNGATLFDKDGRPEQVLGKIHDIDEQKRKEEALKEKSQKDSLTGLLNHMTAQKVITKRLEKLKNNASAYLVVCDIDNFKDINDTNGHLFGDAVLCSFADSLQALMPEAVVGRIGGDEFLVYIEDVDRQELQRRLVTLNQLLSDRYDDERNGMHISCSLGVAAVSGDMRDYQIIFQWADSALYKVKSSGKGAYLIVDVLKNMQLPEKSYLSSEQNKDAYVRNETLIRNEEELLLFCMELLENVPNISSALKMISERTCRYFDLDDMICVEHNGDAVSILYQWGMQDNEDFAKRMYQAGVYPWSRLSASADKRGALYYREAQTNLIESEEGKSVMLVFSKDYKDYQGSVVFDDRRKDRDWEKERETLIRLANQIFARLRGIHLEEKEQAELDRKLNYDALTNLPVYNRFIAMAEEHLAIHGKKGMYCVYCDFSNFQYMNEVYGYETGDQVLRKFAAALEEQWTGWHLFGRVTSDHFVGLIEASSIQEAHDRFLDLSRRFSIECGQEYVQSNLVISSGLYEIQETDHSMAAMLDNANEARKECKEQKRFITTVMVYTDEIKQRIEGEKTIMTSVLSAYNNQEFYAYLQPKISIKTGKIVGAEALARWIRPDGTRMMPDQFIHIFERNGFITRLDFRMLEQVMAYLRDALDKGEDVVPVSVNFSRKHNEYEKFVPSIFNRLEKFQIPGDLIEVEITESVFLADLNRLSENIGRLREKGVKISVDDFGSGYSSLNVLGRVSVDTIKLDKQFLRNQEQNDTAFTIVKYLIKMLKKLGLRVLAEGVETKDQLEMLREADCDLVQGYYYAKPMPIEEFRSFLREFNREH